MEEKQVILPMEHPMVPFSQYVGGWRQRRLPVIRDLNIKVREHEVVVVADPDGSGKSLLAHTVMDLLPQNAVCQGTAFFEGEALNQKRKEQLRGNRMVLVSQSMSYLDPLIRVGEQVRRGQKDKESVKRCRESLGHYGLGEGTEEPYPFELSGGMTGGVLILIAAMEHPRLVIADKPTPGLHIRTVRRMLNRFQGIVGEGAGILLITHDLELALEIAGRIMVFYADTGMEEALAADFEDEQRLRHPCTKALFWAMPWHGFKAASGTQPYATDMPVECPYGPRCPDMNEGCLQETSYHSLRGGMVKCRKAGV